MRGLAEELGVAVTSIYWHVGGRDKLFDSLVDRLLSQMANLPINGDNPVDRIASLARSRWPSSPAKRADWGLRRP